MIRRAIPTRSGRGRGQLRPHPKWLQQANLLIYAPAHPMVSSRLLSFSPGPEKRAD